MFVDNPYINYTYNLLRKKGGVKNYSGYKKGQSSFDQRTHMTSLPNGVIVCPDNVVQRLQQVHEITALLGKKYLFLFLHMMVEIKEMKMQL